MPIVLRELMCHEDIDTTIKFYVGQNSKVVAHAVRATVGNIEGSTDQAKAKAGEEKALNSSGDDRS